MPLPKTECQHAPQRRSPRQAVRAKLGRAFLTVACVVGFVATTACAASRPNIVLFMVDDMGWLDCGVYGSQYYATPNIDRFAQRALRFTDAYAQPLCSPTRASILSGKYSARHGITSATGHQPPQPPGHQFLTETAAANRPMLLPESKNYLDPNEYTLAEALRDAGYRTAHIGKWHLGLTQPHWPEQQGFEVAFHCHPDPGPPGGYFSPYGVIPEGEPRGQVRVGTITDGPAGEYIVDRLTDEAIRFLESSREQPFFLNLWQYGVHGPWGHKAAYTREFAQKQDPRGLQGNPIMASMLRSVDESFGRILETLDRLQIADNTIVIFYSDNGGNVHSNVPGNAKTDRAEQAKSDFLTDWRKWAGDRPPTNNSPLRDGKGTLYEGGTRVPLMWSWPGHIPGGAQSDAVVGHIDFYPTLLELVGLQRPAQQHLDGVSYASVLTGRGSLQREAFFNYFPHQKGSGGVWVRSGDWKLIRWFQPDQPPELYNLKADLGETTSLTAQHPEVTQRLQGLIDGFLQDTGALYPRPNPAYSQAPQPRLDASSEPVQGWVPKFSKLSLKEGVLTVIADGRRPFLGLTQFKHNGPVVMHLRVRSAAGGAGQVQWRTEDQSTFPAEGQTVPFQIPAGTDWSDVAVRIPAEGQLVHLRLYLPADRAPVELDAINFGRENSLQSLKQWTFE